MPSPSPFCDGASVLPAPTRVANTMTVNPIAAALVAGVLVGEPIAPHLVIGLVAVFAGIGLAGSGTLKT
jgi:drug/metabolite transporter (DMT)-like permease